MRQKGRDLRPHAIVLAALLAAGTAHGQTQPPALPGSAPAAAQMPQIQVFVVENSQRTGPFDAQTLISMAANGKLTAQSLVWMDGMGDWAAAASVPVLAPLFASAEPGPNTPPNLPPSGPQGGGGTGINLDQIARQETADFGVAPTNQLHSGPMHGPTPASIPGGKLLTTKELVAMVQARQKYLIFDVLGGEVALPGAVDAVPASQPGSFQDQVSQRMGSYLGQATGGDTAVPLIFYCASTQCWMSYNAALRAINLGYTNVLWYRGGLEAWQAAGMPTMPRGQQPQSQQTGN